MLCQVTVGWEVQRTGSERVSTDQAGLPALPLVVISQLQDTQQSVRVQVHNRSNHNAVSTRRWLCQVHCHLGAGCGFPTALQTNKHDDVVLALGGGPGLHTGVHKLKQSPEP